MTIANIEEIFIEQMPGYYDHDEIKAIAALAVLHVCGYSKSYYMLHKNTDLLLSQETALIRILDELRFGKPLQHVLGEAHFYGLKFRVDANVLVPRPETEELVDWIIKSINLEKISSQNILDIGTGSGCIPVAIKKHVPASTIFAVDISNDALQIAMQNSRINDVEVNWLLGDILDEGFSIPNTTFNIIVSNPPYISLSEKTEMHEHVLHHEPHQALFVPDDNPLAFYDAIARFSLKYLSDDGCLFLEINENFGYETCQLLKDKGFNTELRKDLQGKDRMIKASKVLPVC